MSSKSSVLRKSFPRVTKVIDKRSGKPRYQIDTRKGQGGGRFFRDTEKEALAEAKKLAEEIPVDRGLGIQVSNEVRAMAHKCMAKLAPLGKTIEDATTFYIEHLMEVKRKEESRTIDLLAREWYAEKKAGKQKSLRKDTLESIEEAARTLRKQFGSKKILEVTEEELVAYLESLKAGHRRRFNIKSIFSQFFNWCRARKHIKENPLNFYKITVPKKEPSVLTIETCERLAELISTKHEHLGLYAVLCLFAGIRPSECSRLRLEDINIPDRVIHIRMTRSKTHEGRDVRIEDNLLLWINRFSKGRTTGPVVRTANLRTQLEDLRADLGFKVKGRNSMAEKWPEDVLRHTYASNWLSLHKDRPRLAEYMGNSPRIIGQKYHKPVPEKNAKRFWEITPTSCTPV
jgi:integrase